MRNAFADEITKLAALDARIVLLSGDIGNRLFDDFRAESGERFFNCGVAEANMMSAAAGLALSGFRPFCYSITPFVTTRCLEQIRVDVCYHQQPVTIVGVGAGLGYACEGATHHACEDIAFLRALPGMTVLCPGDAVEVRLALRAVLDQAGPVYLRLGKKGEPVVHAAEPPFAIGRAIALRQGEDVCLLSTGTLLPVAVAAADLLEASGIATGLTSFHTVKPLDEDHLAEVCDRYPVVVTIEEHSLIGGFGAAVAEWLADGPAPRTGSVRLVRIGTADRFLREAGEQAHARACFDLTPEAICRRARDAFCTVRRPLWALPARMRAAGSGGRRR
jgi:transketolase